MPSTRSASSSRRIPVTLNTDDPQHVCTTIGREYAIAARLGFLLEDLLSVTRAAARASFTSATGKATLLAELVGTGVPGGGEV